MSPRRNRGVTTTEQGWSKLREARGQKKMTFEAIAEKAGIGLSTVQRFFQGNPVDEETAIKIIKSVGLEPLEIELIKGKDNPKNTDEDTMPEMPCELVMISMV